MKQPYALLLFTICAHVREFTRWISSERRACWVQCLHTRSHHWTPDPTVTRYFNGKTKKCMGTSMMTPNHTELHWRVYKNEPKISSKDFPKVNDPTISKFMATFSAWIIRVPDHRVLRCGSLQIKSEKNCWFYLYTWCWGKGFGGSPEYWPQNGASWYLALHPGLSLPHQCGTILSHTPVPLTLTPRSRFCKF